jgi:4-hydroxybenzoate polyprenyltransferase
MKEDDSKYKHYLEQRKAYDEMELEMSGRYDKWILTLSAGAFGISLAFIEKIAPSPHRSAVWLLVVAWGFLLSTIILGLVSFLTSQSAIRRMRDMLDRSIEDENRPQQPNPSAKRTNTLNYFSMLTFTIGVSFLCAFSICNITK